jgi:hypothetical protein
MDNPDIVENPSDENASEEHLLMIIWTTRILQ